MHGYGVHDFERINLTERIRMSYIKSLATCNPFLRWAGGKSWLLPIWYKLIDKLMFNQYHEPFVGGGTSFFALPGVHKSYLSDVNKELILAYKMVKDFPEELYAALTNLKTRKRIITKYVAESVRQKLQKQHDLYI